MSKQTRALAWLCASVGAALAPAGARGVEITQTAPGVIKQTSTLDPTTTDFDGSTVAPLVFQKFDTQGGQRVLDSVSLNFIAKVQNQFSMTFINPATITESFKPVGSTSTGPTLTLYQPDGKTPLLVAQEPNDPSALTRSVTYGGKAGQTYPQTFSSTLASTSPYYIAPTTATATGAQTLTSPADLTLFTKTSTSSTLSLPMSASAFASISSSSGNGAGAVSTKGNAKATVTYTWHQSSPAPQTGIGQPQPTPEPAAVLLWGAGGAALLAARRVRRDRVRV